MNSRIILLLMAFAAWSYMSWRWYVCKIKKVCPGQELQLTTPNITSVSGIVDSLAVATDQLGTTVDSLTSAATSGAEALAAEGGEIVAAVASKVKPVKESKPALQESAPTSDAPEEHISIEETANEAIIHFPYNSTRKVDDEEMDGYLSKLATRLKSSGEKITITGHTDGIGDPKTNNDLAMRRAQSIRAILVKKGVSSKSIICRSFGERKPVASDDTPQGRYKNRRAIITVQ